MGQLERPASSGLGLHVEEGDGAFEIQMALMGRYWGLGFGESVQEDIHTYC